MIPAIIRIFRILIICLQIAQFFRIIGFVGCCLIRSLLIILFISFNLYSALCRSYSSTSLRFYGYILTQAADSSAYVTKL